MSEDNIKADILQVYKGGPTEDIPVGVYDRFLPRGNSGRKARNLGLGLIDYHPITTMLAPPWHMYEGYISEVKGAEFSVEYSWKNNKLITRRIYETPEGILSQELEKGIGTGSEAIREQYIEDLEDYEKMRYLVENTVFRHNKETIEKKQEDLGDDGVLFGRLDRSPYQKVLIELASPERFLLDLQKNPDPVIELLETMERKLDEQLEMAFESDLELFWQPDNITSDMTPPKRFEQFHVPFYKKRVEKLKDSNKTYIIHMDGKIKALSDLITEVDFDVIESFSLPEIGGNMTYAEAKKTFTDKVIVPNFPSNLCHRYKDNEDIKDFIDKLFKEVTPEDPFMIQISEDIPMDEWHRVIPVIVEYVKSKRR